MQPTPQDIHDPIFGHLKWNTDVEWYEGGMEIVPGSFVRLTFQNDVDVEFSEVIAVAHKQFEPLKSKLPEIYAEVRREYLNLYYSSWAGAANGNGQPANRGKLTAAEFDALVCLKDVSFKYGKMVDLWYSEDEGLFGGHSILVQLDDELNVMSTGLEG
jgi:hypothetical protein